MLDIHVSAMQLGEATSAHFLELGFVADHFQNCQRCAIVAYHGTYRGGLAAPDNRLWRNLRDLVGQDNGFSGIVEEEQIIRRHDFASLPTTVRRAWDMELGGISPVPTRLCPPSLHKACDVHIRIIRDSAPPFAIELLERLEISSFERPRDGMMSRVYTATFEVEEHGHRFLALMIDLLSRLGVSMGQAKLERTLRFIRKPSDAISLPIVGGEEASGWFARYPQFMEDESPTRIRQLR